jgi:hypothetical protein
MTVNASAYEQHRVGIMEIGTDTTARIAADILIAALEAKAVAPGGLRKSASSRGGYRSLMRS